jgi:hypothetical protein
MHEICKNIYSHPYPYLCIVGCEFSFVIEVIGAFIIVRVAPGGWRLGRTFNRDFG